MATKRCAAAAVAASKPTIELNTPLLPRGRRHHSQHGVRCPAPWSGSSSPAGQRLALEAVAVLASCGALYLLDNGALLGFWRICDFLDADLDITVPASWWSIAQSPLRERRPAWGRHDVAQGEAFGRLRSVLGVCTRKAGGFRTTGRSTGGVCARSDVSMGHALLQRDPVLGLPDTIQKRGGRTRFCAPPTEWLRRAVVGWTSGAGSIAYARLPEAAYGPKFETPDPHWKEDQDRDTVGSCAMAGSRRLPQLASRCGLDVSCETQEAWQSKENFPFGDSVPCTITERAAGVATSLSANLAPCLNVTRGSDTCGNGESTWPTDCSTSVTPHKCRRATTICASLPPAKVRTQ